MARQYSRLKAGRYARQEFVSGKTVDQLLALDSAEFQQLSKSELRQVVQRLASATNKRIKSLESSGYDTPALRQFRDAGSDKASTKGKDLAALRSEYKRIKTFYQGETSTKRGWEKVRDRSVSAAKREGVSLTVDDFDRFWKAYDRLKERAKAGGKAGMLNEVRYKVMEYLAGKVESGKRTPNQAASDVFKRLDKIYEEVKKEDDRGSNTSVSSFFDTDEDVGAI